MIGSLASVIVVWNGRAKFDPARSGEGKIYGMMPSVFLNGRFLSQSVTGVQRFSAEIAFAIDRLVTAGDWPETTILAPRSVGSTNRIRPPSSYKRLRLKEVGRTQGHLWEQTELPGAVRDGVLVSLGNTAPVLAGRRQVVVIHDAGVFDTPESYPFRFRAWYKTLQRRLVRTGVRIVTVSEFSRRRLVARLGMDPNDIAVMYEGADHILRKAPDTFTLERHGLCPRRFALVVGNRVAHKNHEALREAAAMLERRGMVIAVVGASDPAVYREVFDFGFVERRLNRVSDAELRVLYENAVCLLFPSRYEGFGLPPVEAMACSCPVLAARGGAVEEICADAALYFTTDDQHTVVAALEQLLDEDKLADTLRAHGRTRAAALSWDASARTLGREVQCVQ